MGKNTLIVFLSCIACVAVYRNIIRDQKMERMGATIEFQTKQLAAEIGKSNLLQDSIFVLHETHRKQLTFWRDSIDRINHQFGLAKQIWKEQRLQLEFTIDSLRNASVLAQNHIIKQDNYYLIRMRDQRVQLLDSIDVLHQDYQGELRDLRRQVSNQTTAKLSPLESVRGLINVLVSTGQTDDPSTFWELTGLVFLIALVFIILGLVLMRGYYKRKSFRI